MTIASNSLICFLSIIAAAEEEDHIKNIFI
jgi:hypothetical protein